MPSQPAPDPEETLVAEVGGPRSFASGRYTVHRVLGEGGQKIVYLVHDEALDRDCALSMVKAELLEPDDLERLRREAQAMARLGAHSNIVTVHDIGDEDGKPYLVCEYVPAGELRQHLRDATSPLPLERALAIAADISRALAMAHGRGVIHRDVKPANVWLCDDGSAKLGDFGLAFSIDRSRLTMPGTVLGTAMYIAPEQARGDPADARADLYALGCLLYELICGHPPFTDANAAVVIAQHLNAPPAAPSSHVADLPPALNDLILRLLAKSPDARPATAAAVGEEIRAIGESLRTADAHLGPEASELEPPPAQPGFVGRAPELEQLTAALDRTSGGAGSLVLVAGEPGIGKTRLLEQFAAQARGAGARVLTGRCYDGDWAPPFSPFVEAIKQHAATTPAKTLRADLGLDAGVLARIVPALHERLPNIAEPPAIPPEGERYRLLEAVSGTLGHLAAERPLVLVLDDLHWADKGTIAMLQQVTRASAAQRVLVLGAYRDVELDRTHPLADALGGLRREKGFERIALRGLEGAEVAELLVAIAEQDVPTALSEAIARETDGNPFFIKEVLLHLVEEKMVFQEDGRWISKLSIAEMGIPEGVREVIGRRLSRVSETCGRMLTVASALTAGFSWDVISAISDAGDAALLDAVDEALGAQLIVERERGRYDFTHALIRHTLYEELSTPRRVLLHRQIGEALEKLYAADIEPRLAELAHHFYEAAAGGDAAKAVEYERRAGERALVLVAYDEAVSHYERALQVLDLSGRPNQAQRCELLLGLGDATFRKGDASGARQAYREATAVARSEALPEGLARAVLRYGRWLETDDAIDLLEESLAALDERDSALRASLLATLASASFSERSRDQRASVITEAIAMARRLGDVNALRDVLARGSWALWTPENVEEQLAAMTEVLRLSEASGDRAGALSARTQRIYYLFDLGKMLAVDEEIEVYARLSEELRQPSFLWRAPAHRAMRALFDGRFDEVEALSQQALAAGRRVEPQRAMQTLQAQTFGLRREQGRLQEIEAPLRDLARRWANAWAPVFRCTLAFFYAELGRLREARQEFERAAADEFAGIPRDYQWLPAIAWAAEACALLDDGTHAVRLYELLLPYAGRNVVIGDQGYCLGPGSRYLGLLAATIPDWNKAEQHFEDALGMSRRMGTRPWLARTQLDYARMLRKHGAALDASRSRELLEEALATAQAIGMAKVVADCEALLVAGG